ncbi:hypothetical protein M072_4508 [Bacteroides fragilis str. DS-208]|nr:hypothetical protein M072_4508 [Bacteroides fragilis str. DS-208]
MTYWNLGVECSQSTSGRGGGIAMNEYDIRMALLEHVTQTSEDACGYIGEILTQSHNIKVVIRDHIEDL